MYDITKARRLLTTAVFAAVAVVFAGGANARIPEDGSGIGAEPVAVVAPTVDPLASTRLTGLLRAARTRDRESGALSGEQQAPQESGTFSVEEICAAHDLEQTRGVLINEQAIKAASPGAIQECSHAAAPAAKPTVPVLRYNSPTGTGQQRVARYSRTTAAGLRAAQAKFCADTKLIHDWNEEVLDQRWSQDAIGAMFQSKNAAERNACAWAR